MFVYEGCMNDDKIFIGGKTQMIKFYCKMLPHTSNCKKITQRNNSLTFDEKLNKIFENPDLSDKIFDSITKAFDKEDKYI